MGCLRFTVDDVVQFTSLASALQNVGNGAFTMVVLMKRASVSTWMGLSYLKASGVTQYGVSFRGSAPIDALVCDTVSAGSQASSDIFTDTSSPYLFALSKGDGLVIPRLSWKLGAAGGWTHGDMSATHADGAVCDEIEVGAWATSADFLDGWIGVVAWYEGAMSDANKEALDNNWQTSDLYSSAHGAPLALIEFNTDTPTDVIGNATGIIISGTTLDTGETLESWNFNGNGVPPQQLRPDADITTTGWSTTPLWSKIDEDTPDGVTISGVAS